jgi:hypothetical protein
MKIHAWLVQFSICRRRATRFGHGVRPFIRLMPLRLLRVRLNMGPSTPRQADHRRSGDALWSACKQCFQGSFLAGALGGTGIPNCVPEGE